MTDWSQFKANQDAVDLLAAAAVVVGLSTCLFGVRLWRILLGAMGLLVGGIGAAQYASMHANDRVYVVAGLGLCTGCVMMVALATLYRFGTIITFAALGWYAGTLMGRGMALSGGDLILCALIVAGVFGTIAKFVETPVIMGLSAAAGAWAVVWGASLYFDNGFSAERDAVELLRRAGSYGGQLAGMALLAAAGLALQILEWRHSGPDLREVENAMEQADPPRRKRMKVLENLRSDGTISRAEYYKHLVRILSGC